MDLRRLWTMVTWRIYLRFLTAVFSVWSLFFFCRWVEKVKNWSCGVRIENHLFRANQNVNLFQDINSILGNLHGFSKVCTHFVGGSRIHNCPNRWQVSYIVLSDRSYATLSLKNEFLQNSQPQARCRTVPETSRTLSIGNQGTNERGSQNDPHPEVGVSLSHWSQDLSTEETCYSYRLE